MGCSTILLLIVTASQVPALMLTTVLCIREWSKASETISLARVAPIQEQDASSAVEHQIPLWNRYPPRSWW
jgi:hypothetical protein